jgi:polyisoprenyl-teichoic acid--peptidoglycan teichoic acid transferase
MAKTEPSGSAPAPSEGAPAPSTRRSQRRSTPPATAPSKGRHRVKGKSWAPAPRRRHRGRSRLALRLPSAPSLGRLGIVVLVLAVVAAAVVGLRSLGKDDAASGGETTPGLAQAPITTLFVGTDIGGTRAAWLALLSFDPVQDQGAIVYVPAHTAVEIPGRGLQGMGDAMETGGLPLLLVSAESFFGIKIDNYLEVPRTGLEAMFEQLGPVTVDVPSDVALAEGSDTQRLLLSAGTQELGAFQLADLLYTVGADGDDVELGARHLAFWDAVAETFATNPTALRTAFRSLETSSSGERSTSGNNADLVASLAALGDADLTLAILPVQQVSVGGAELYATDAEEIAQFVTDTLPGVPVVSDQVRIQVLNGNGVPGIGQEVAEKLVGRGFRIVLSGNANSFKYNKTKVITYDSSPEGQELAARARDLLGVGEVQVSGQGQGSVDLTIIVGKDFLRTP